MDLKSKIYIAGHKGLVGSAFHRVLIKKGYKNVIIKSHEDLDLMNQVDVHKYFDKERPEYVFFAAAKVGGIYANSVFPADFIHQNIQIQSNIIDASFRNKVKRMIFLGSSCIYPRNCNQPIKEEYLLTGPLEKTNAAYSLAKIAGIETCKSFNKQYFTKFLSLMPSNLYGPGDNYDLNNCHVLPALVRKFHEAKINNFSNVEVWGTGLPKREFLFVEDLADAAFHLYNIDEDKLNSILFDDIAPGLLNVGYGKDLTIKELAKIISNIIGYKGNVTYNTSMPDGTPQKLLDISRIKSLGWEPKTKLIEGLKLTYEAYIKESASLNYNK